MQNSTAVFQLNISNNIGFCASKSRPNAKPRNVIGNITMKQLKTIFVIIFLLFSFKIFATEQFPDILHYKGKKYEWKGVSPGIQYFREKGFTAPEDALVTTANTNVFLMEYEITDGKLFLTDVEILLLDNQNKLTSKSVFKDYFPNQSKFLLSNFTKIILIPYGEEKKIEYKDEDWYELFKENYLVFEINKGIVINEFDLTYNKLDKFKRRQFRFFKRTPEYKISKVKEFDNFKFYNEQRPAKLNVSLDEYLRRKILTLTKQLK